MTKRRIVVCLLLLAAAAVGLALSFLSWDRTQGALPEAPEVQSMTASLYNSPQRLPDVPEFTVPPEHVPRILQAMRPAERDNFPAKWQVLGTVSIVTTTNESIRVQLYWTRQDNGAFSVRQVGQGGGLFSSGDQYYRGGTDKDIEDAIRTAYADSLKGT